LWFVFCCLKVRRMSEQPATADSYTELIKSVRENSSNHLVCSFPAIMFCFLSVLRITVSLLCRCGRVCCPTCWAITAGALIRWQLQKVTKCFRFSKKQLGLFPAKLSLQTLNLFLCASLTQKLDCIASFFHGSKHSIHFFPLHNNNRESIPSASREQLVVTVGKNSAFFYAGWIKLELKAGVFFWLLWVVKPSFSEKITNKER